MDFFLGPLDPPDPAARMQAFASKRETAATRKCPEEGFTRPWPDEIRMTPEVKSRIDALWGKLGLK